MNDLDVVKSMAEWETGIGYVVAAAGCGKTYSIADAVSKCPSKQLILTHTHAAVKSIKNKLKALNVSSTAFKVETIDSWTKRYIHFFPKMSGFPLSKHTERDFDYNNAKKAMLSLLEFPVVLNIISNSYSGIFVDEYQDCDRDQHEIIKKISDVLPCRILGDPLQGIFNFRSQDAIIWENDISLNCTKIGELTNPWRWRTPGSSENLGDWLAEARENIVNGDISKIIDSSRISELSIEIIPSDENLKKAAQINKCRNLLNLAGSDSLLVVNCQSSRPLKSIEFAKSMRGRIQPLESVEFIDLVEAAEELDSSQNVPLDLFKLFAKCTRQFTGYTPILNALLSQTRRPRTCLEIIDGLKSAATKDPDKMRDSLKLLWAHADTPIFRREFLQEIIKVIERKSTCPEDSFYDCAVSIRNESRIAGRYSLKHAIGTTLLVKGLEYDHVIILDASQFENEKHLYVAITRARKSLTILSSKNTLHFDNSGSVRQRPGAMTVETPKLALDWDL